jgi:hypothetical protein
MEYWIDARIFILRGNTPALHYSNTPMNFWHDKRTVFTHSFLMSPASV